MPNQFWPISYRFIWTLPMVGHRYPGFASFKSKTMLALIEHISV